MRRLKGAGRARGVTEEQTAPSRPRRVEHLTMGGFLRVGLRRLSRVPIEQSESPVEAESELHTKRRIGATPTVALFRGVVPVASR
jgi:hypothetical protein